MLALIAAGGDAPDRKEFMALAKKADLVIAADAGLDWLFRFGVIPHIMVGDFDSARKHSIVTYQRLNVEALIVPAEKDETDTMLAARYALEKGADTVLLFGCTGGRLDHTLANIHVLAFLKKNGVKARIIDKKQIIELAGGSFELHGEVGETVSLMPFMGNATVTLRDGGLRYPLNALELNDTFAGTSNIMERSSVPMKIVGRIVVIRNRKK